MLPLLGLNHLNELLSLKEKDKEVQSPPAFIKPSVPLSTPSIVLNELLIKTKSISPISKIKSISPISKASAQIIKRDRAQRHTSEQASIRRHLDLTARLNNCEGLLKDASTFYIMTSRASFFETKMGDFDREMREFYSRKATSLDLTSKRTALHFNTLDLTTTYTISNKSSLALFHHSEKSSITPRLDKLILDKVLQILAYRSKLATLRQRWIKNHAQTDLIQRNFVLQSSDRNTVQSRAAMVEILKRQRLWREQHQSPVTLPTRQNPFVNGPASFSLPRSIRPTPRTPSKDQLLVQSSTGLKKRSTFVWDPFYGREAARLAYNNRSSHAILHSATTHSFITPFHLKSTSISHPPAAAANFVNPFSPSFPSLAIRSIALSISSLTTLAATQSRATKGIENQLSEIFRLIHRLREISGANFQRSFGSPSQSQHNILAFE
jgi:hypothetical protein